MNEGWLPDLLQFVPNMEIAQNYLKDNFFLRDILDYNQVSKNKNSKYDEDEGTMLDEKIEPHVFFISCFTVLNPSFFDEKGGLKKEVIDGLNLGNVDKDGKTIERPFITISSNNFKQLTCELKSACSVYFKKQNILSSGLATRGVEYLKDSCYNSQSIKYSKKLDELPHSVLGGKRILAVTQFNKQQKETYEKCMGFLCWTKRCSFFRQNEYRFMILLYSKKLRSSELEIPIPDLHNLIKVHEYSDIYKITKDNL